MQALSDQVVNTTFEMEWEGLCVELLLCGCEVCPLISIPICLQSMLFNPISILKKKKKTQEYFLHKEWQKSMFEFLNQNYMNHLGLAIHHLCRGSNGHKTPGQWGLEDMPWDYSWKLAECTVFLWEMWLLF